MNNMKDYKELLATLSEEELNNFDKQKNYNDKFLFLSKILDKNIYLIDEERSNILYSFLKKFEKEIKQDKEQKKIYLQNKKDLYLYVANKFIDRTIDYYDFFKERIEEEPSKEELKEILEIIKSSNILAREFLEVLENYIKEF